MMHILNVRCPNLKCQRIFRVRKPNSEVLISLVLPLLKCPYCSREQDGMCGGCRLPLSIVGQHTPELCIACFQKEWRWNKKNPL